MPELIDIHCHLDFKDFDGDREEVIKRTLDAGVWMINVGVDLETSKKSIELAEKHKGIFAAVGLHPTDKDAEKFEINAFRELAQHPKVVAIGECGIDMFRRLNVRSSTLNSLQKDIFKQQIELAVELNKPLMIHCRDAHDEVLSMLNSGVRGNVHFFSGNREQAERYLELGFSLSFTGVITFARQYDEIIKSAPFDRIMVETDSPFVAPIPYRGQRCEPLYVKEVAKRIAEIRDISYEEVAKQTTQNAINFFGL